MEYLGIRTDLLLLLTTAFISFFLYPFWINFVYRLNMGEVSRVHEQKQGVPTMGGFVFVIAVAFITVIFNSSRNQTLLPLFVACLAGLLGLLEDFAKVYTGAGLPGFIRLVFEFLFDKEEHKEFNTKSRNFLVRPWYAFREFSRSVGSSGGTGIATYQKFIIQGLIAGFVSYWVYFKLGWDYIWMPLIGNIHVGIIYPIFVLFFFIFVLNSVGFTDGLDGLAGGLSVFAFAVFWAMARVLEYNSLAGFAATFIGALLPFLYFNIYPARIMMGNVGSHVLGSVLALFAVLIHREIAFFLIGLVFLIDGISSPLQQYSVKITGKRIFRMAPLHHHFEKLGWPETKVTFRFWLFGMLFGVLGLFISLL